MSDLSQSTANQPADSHSTQRGIAAIVSGIIFGLGLAVSQMINPEKVVGFLDVTGNWDPSLALVLGGAVVVVGGAIVVVVVGGLLLPPPQPRSARLSVTPTASIDSLRTSTLALLEPVAPPATGQTIEPARRHIGALRPSGDAGHAPLPHRGSSASVPHPSISGRMSA